MADILWVELRNRIYDFATEASYEGWLDPPPFLMHHCCDVKKQWPMTNTYFTARKFFGLTQVCKQIRAEYRPLWLRNSSVRIHLSHLNLFLQVFHEPRWTIETSPKLLQISWDHNDDFARGQHPFDITKLLHLRAHCPSTKIEFVAHGLAEGEGPDLEDDCWVCMEDPDSDADDPDYECHHGEAMYEDWVDFMMREYWYLRGLNRFLSKKDPTWLAQIREHGILQVHLTLESLHGGEGVVIGLSHKAASRIKGKGSLITLAENYLKSVGLADEDWPYLPIDVSFHTH